MNSDISFVRTAKKCRTCGGRFKLEKSSDGKVRKTILFCENFCFVKEEVKTLNQNRPWAEYTIKDGKHYLATYKDPVPRQCYISGDKKGSIRVKTLK